MFRWIGFLIVLLGAIYYSFLEQPQLTTMSSIKNVAVIGV
jgi:hypothetical protein